jgi:hypothetical protein
MRSATREGRNRAPRPINAIKLRRQNLSARTQKLGGRAPRAQATGGAVSRGLSKRLRHGFLSEKPCRARQEAKGLAVKCLTPPEGSAAGGDRRFRRHIQRACWLSHAGALDCRVRALRCSEAASGTAELRVKALLVELAELWIKLAAELEQSNTEVEDQVLGHQSNRRRPKL